VNASPDELAWAISTIASALHGCHGGEPGVGEVMARLGEQEFAATTCQPVRPARLPACRFLPDVIGEAMVHSSHAAAAIAAIEDSLDWRQNPNYSDEAMGQPGYMRNYAYAELIGPSGPFAGDDFLLGLFVLGPGIHYLDHHHAAPELYWVLTEGSEWRRDSSGFVPRRGGETIWHEPWVSHATRTGSNPLLAVYAWTRDTKAHARLKARQDA